jgi:hypothetical protein
MANRNGDNNIERRFEQLGELVRGLIKHAESTEKQLETIGLNMEKLRESHVATLNSVQGLVGAIRELIDRIPPENLRLAPRQYL